MNKHLFSLSAVLFVMLFGFISCSGSKDNPTPPPGPQFVAVTGITLDRTTITNDVTKQEKLTPTIYPENATVKSVTWATSDETRAKVDNSGLITIIGSGKATITAKAGDKTATCEVNGIGPDIYLTSTQGLYKNGFELNLWPIFSGSGIPPNGRRDVRAFTMVNDDVYAVGSVIEGGIRRYAYWKNGDSPIVLQDDSSRVQAICVSAGDVYIGGYESGGVLAPDKGKLWKNGIEQPLDSYKDYPPHGVTSIAVLNDDVYAVGTITTSFEIIGSGGAYTGFDNVLWKNGKVVLAGDNHPQHVFLAGNDIYVVGYICDPLPVATLWVNNVPQRLPVPNGTYSSKAIQVFVSGDNVYVRGFYFLNGQKRAIDTIWKNGVRQDLPPDFISDSFFVHGSDVYVVGAYLEAYYDIKKLLKNGVEQYEVRHAYTITTIYPLQGIFVK